MNIIEAANKLKEGKKIRRKSWQNINVWKTLYLENDLFLCQNGEIFHKHIPSEENFRFEFHLIDILADDWEVME
jgi:hypothetical protein